MNQQLTDPDEDALHDLLRNAEASGADYYAVLNVPRTASAAAINDAYKRLSRVFHPDRHTAAEQRQWAQRHFHGIQRAHEVLSDDATRAAYDALGEAGVPIARAVGHKVQSARDLHAHFEREARRRRTEDIEQWVQSKSEAAPVVRFTRGRAAVESLAVSHSFTSTLSESTALVVAANMFARQGRGSGNVVATLRRALGAAPPSAAAAGGGSWVSVSAPALPPYAATVDAVHQLPHGAFATTRVALRPRSAPAATVTLGRALTPTTVGALTVRTGSQYAAPLPGREPSGVALSLQGSRGARTGYAVEVAAARAQSHVSARCTRRVDAHFALTAGVTAVTTPRGLADVSASVGLRADASAWTRVGWRVDFGLAAGVTATLSVRRLGHRLRLPLLLTPALDMAVVLAAAAAPIAAALALHLAVLAPRRRRLVRQQIADLRDEQRAQLHRQRRHAEEAARLMAPHAERARAQARAAGGLVIERALYGDLPFALPAENCNAAAAAVDGAAQSAAALLCADEPRACDVTLPLAALVAGDQLVVAGGASKRFLPGFYDPAFGAPKALFVRYLFRGAVHEAVVRDDEALAIPMQAHALEG